MIGPLGRGGSATVFRAFDPGVSRHVAIKVLTDSIDSKDLARLRSEARAAGRLHHRNVVSIFDLEVEDGKPYLIMELLEGNDLSNSLPPDTQMGIREAVEIMHQVAHGLLHAHSHGVVHRDVSPQNIWLQPDGTVKLIDFGIAGGLQGTRTLSDTNAPLGTVLFLSPEHLGDSSAELDPRSDIFSYGVVFYQLLSGRNPFAGLDDRETVCNILLREPAPLLEIRPDCPAPLAQIVHRALLKDLELRYRSFQDLLIDLDLVQMMLRRADANELLESARVDFGENRLEAAREAVNRILELVSDHSEARELLAKIKDRQRQIAVRARVRELLLEAGQHSQERRSQEAILILEKAHRLDSASSEVTERLEEVRSALERQARCIGLIKQAEEHRREGRLEEAMRAAVEAATADSGEVEAVGLVEALRGEVEADRQRRVSEGLAHARQLLKEEQFVAAEAVLSSLAEQQVADAPQVRLLLTYAQNESSRRKRKQVVESARNEAIRRAAFGEYTLALVAIDQALEQYPDDPDLALIRVSTQANIFEQTRGAARARRSKEGESSQLFCVCRHTLNEGAKFCDQCGAQIN